MQNTILEKIIASKKKWINKNKKWKSTQDLNKKVKNSNRNFYDVFYSNKKNFILECKKSSPSKGNISDNFNITNIVNIYSKYASVISVLTDQKYFSGSFDFLYKISLVVKQPILCKDFIIDPWQIYLARLYNADAILLMLSILNDSQYLTLMSIAHNLNMGILTEVNNNEECDRALKLKAKIIGINNRNLHDLSIDLNRTKTLSLKLLKNHIIISESGIENNQQIRELSKYVHGFLIGSTLMKEKNLNIAINRLLIGENKICGLTCLDDANYAYNVGAIYGGLIFVTDSPRNMNIDKAKNIIFNVPLIYVGVFKNESIEKILKIVLVLSLTIIQLHGNENQTYINKLKIILPDYCKIWKVLDTNNPPLIFNYDNIDRYILDNGGGSGKPFNWFIINSIKFNNVMLAGGLSINNCLSAINLGYIGLDFNSGIEHTPGIKNQDKLSKIFNLLRSY